MQGRSLTPSVASTSHDHGHDHHAHGHPHEHGHHHDSANKPAIAQPLTLPVSLLTLGAGARLATVAVLIALLWTATGWALAS